MSQPVVAAPAVVNRLKRAQGQLAGVLRMIEEGRDLEPVVHQLKAVTSAIERAGFAILVAHLVEAVNPENGATEETIAKLEKLFLSMS